MEKRKGEREKEKENEYGPSKYGKLGT